MIEYAALADKMWDYNYVLHLIYILIDEKFKKKMFFW